MPGVVLPMNKPLLLTSVRVWGVEILVAGFNYFVLMRFVYEPLWGDLVAHQVGMTTRITCIFFFAYLLLRYADHYTLVDTMQVGLLWLVLALTFEWAGSILLLRRPVDEILQGWHIEHGYMWPCVLLAYLFANLIVAATLHPQRAPAPAA
jgi:hypothetical protein